MPGVAPALSQPPDVARRHVRATPQLRLRHPPRLAHPLQASGEQPHGLVLPDSVLPPFPQGGTHRRRHETGVLTAYNTRLEIYFCILSCYSSRERSRTEGMRQPQGSHAGTPIRLPRGRGIRPQEVPPCGVGSPPRRAGPGAGLNLGRTRPLRARIPPHDRHASGASTSCVRRSSSPALGGGPRSRGHAGVGAAGTVAGGGIGARAAGVALAGCSPLAEGGRPRSPTRPRACGSFTVRPPSSCDPDPTLDGSEKLCRQHVMAELTTPTRRVTRRENARRLIEVDSAHSLPGTSGGCAPTPCWVSVPAVHEGSRRPPGVG